MKAQRGEIRFIHQEHGASKTYKIFVGYDDKGEYCEECISSQLGSKYRLTVCMQDVSVQSRLDVTYKLFCSLM